MKIESIKISKLKAAPYNPRTSTAKQEDNLKASLEKFGVVEPVVYNKQTGNIVGGHFRVRELKKMGVKEVPCVVVDLSIDDEKELNIRLNANTGEWDWEMLANEWDSEQLDEWGLDVPDFTVKELEAEEDDYEVPDQIHTDIVLGDLFEIGEHRLLCGDSTDSDAVAKLMNGEKADISFTSPPYNTKENAKLSPHQKNGTKYNSYSDDLEDDEYLKLLMAFTQNSLLFSEYSFVNIQSLSGNKTALIDFLYNMKSMYADTIIWQKQNAQPAMAENVLNSQFEYIHIFSHKANRAIGTKKFRGTLSNVLEISKQTKNKVKEHNATFPINLPSHFVSNFCVSSVIDLFLGSGTTMVAAHQLNRKCYGMELDPKYCQVIVDRMLKLDPTLEVKRNGQPYHVTVK